MPFKCPCKFLRTFKKKREGECSLFLEQITGVAISHPEKSADYQESPLPTLLMLSSIPISAF
jgi:hypothetical protein